MIPTTIKAYLICLFLCIQILPQAAFAQQDSTKLWKVTAGDVIPPVTLGLASLIVQGKISRHLQERVVSNYPNYRTKVDEYLPYVPGVVSLGLASAGVKGKHKLGDQVILAILSNVIAQGVTQSLKRIVKYPRPNEEDNHSFPSGHATTAFTNATILHEEYSQRSILYSIGGYGTATTVGAMRVLGNHHWLADVLMGAGIGIGATKIVYISYPWMQQQVRRMKARRHDEKN
ncbi:MAG: phosphatase PAP2 family protein [Dyadobacter sp.]|uniref:phosphatase PAP2 family protein n=1 Tax=Dyadobacter sp. TaxID=1914288 RepID=UPI001B1D5EDB|nr:phosphatase PAP2 family protein [Dyadobacter sp.]MBO9615733.1 phosphatase PAP2 family protein [Dyadobacter sp.]